MSFALASPTTTADGAVKMPWRWLVPTDPNDPRWASDPAGPETARFRDAVERGVTTTEERITQNARDIERTEKRLQELSARQPATDDDSGQAKALRDRLVFLHERRKLAEQEKLGLQEWLDKLAAGTRIAVETHAMPKIVEMESFQSRLGVDRTA